MDTKKSTTRKPNLARRHDGRANNQHARVGHARSCHNRTAVLKRQRTLTDTMVGWLVATSSRFSMPSGDAHMLLFQLLPKGDMRCAWDLGEGANSMV